MSPLPGNAYLSRLSEALVSEIKAEMGRRDLSARGLAAIIGENPQYVTSRIGAGNPRTGKRVELTVADLATIAGVFDLEPIELYGRAVAAMDFHHPSSGGVVIEADFGKSSEPPVTVDESELADERSAAQAPPKKDVEGESEGEQP